MRLFIHLSIYIYIYLYIKRYFLLYVKISMFPFGDLSPKTAQVFKQRNLTSLSCVHY